MSDVARRRRERREEPVALLGVELAEEVGLLVGGHRLDDRRRALGVEARDERGAILELRLVEDAHDEIEGERGEHRGGGDRLETVERLGDVGAPHLGEHRRQLGGVVREEVEEFGGDGGHAAAPRGGWRSPCHAA